MERILHIIGKMDRAGAETMLMNLYRNINRDKYQFDFVVFTNDKGDYDDEINALGGKIIPIIEANPFKRLLSLERFLKANKEYKIVHAHTLFSNAFHILAAKRAKVPFRISHSHNTDDQARGFLISKIYKTLSKKIIDTYSTYKIACGEEAAKCLFVKKSLQEVLILPNAIDSQLFYKIGTENSDYINENFCTQKDTLKIVQIGRMLEVKNHSFSIQIAKKLKEKGVNFKMFFVGRGELSENIENEIKINNLQEQVLMLGLRTDIPLLMAGADIMIMPSLFEGFPVVLVESQSTGLPALISENISKEVDLGLNLIHFAELDIDTWVKKILTIRTQVVNKDNIIPRFYETGFDIHGSVKIIEKIYNNLN
ncbi:MAG: hypothetical protein BGO86_05895 [Chryseobacterium sp. 36-9]|nr:MAG: hypothetical protein BGO86_05895 [Chryseobacterium sp. 36-9]